MVGPKIQAFCPRIDMLKENRYILRRRVAQISKKLGIMLENKVIQKLKLQKKYFLQKLIFLNEFLFLKDSVNF